MDAETIAGEARLHRAVRALSAQSGTPADQIVEWLCSGGLAQMALSHFAPAGRAVGVVRVSSGNVHFEHHDGLYELPDGNYRLLAVAGNAGVVVPDRTTICKDADGTRRVKDE